MHCIPHRFYGDPYLFFFFSKNANRIIFFIYFFYPWKKSFSTTLESITSLNDILLSKIKRSPIKIKIANEGS